MRIIALVVLAGCRIGFDPIEGSPGGDSIENPGTGPDGGVAATTSSFGLAESGSMFEHTCTSGADCRVECSLAASCAVECNGATSCTVTCPAGACTVTDCTDPTCDVLCGASSLPTHHGSTATCP